MKQKTNKAERTCSKSAGRNGPAGNGTNKRKIYRVCFTYKQWGDRFIYAASAEDARAKARLIPTAEPGFWRDYPEEFTVLEIDIIEPEALPKDASVLPISD